MFNGPVSFNESGTSIGSVIGTGAALSAGWFGTKAVGEAVVGALKGAPTPVPPTQFEAATMEAAKVLPWATIVIAAVTLINALIAWLEWPVEQLKHGLLWVIRKLTALINWLNPINWFGKKASVKTVDPAPAVVDPVVADPVVADPAPADPASVAVDPAPAPAPVAVAVDPAPVAVDSAPVAVDPAPVAVDSAPVAVDPAPVAVDPAPVAVTPATKAVNYRGKKKHGR